MNLPENGKVIIIEDDIKAALSLMKALFKKGISATYFDGIEIDMLPKTPIENVRMIFLDVELGTEGQSDKNKVSKVISILRKILGEPRYPYIILAWTRFIVLKEYIEEGLQAYPPLFFLNMEKDECKDEKGDFDVDKIEDKLKVELEKAGIFHLFILWENIVNQAAGKVVKDISRLQTYDGNWNKNMQTIFYEMAKAYSGKQLRQNNVMKPSLMTFNDIFLDTLESRIKNSELDLKISFDKGSLDEKIRAEINSKLLLVLEDDQKIIPGNVYEVKNQKDNIKSIINDAFNLSYIYKFFCEKNSIPGIADLFEKNGSVKKEHKKTLSNFCKKLRDDIAHKSKLIELEISPSCDYYQDKWVYSRLIKGILWNSEFVHFLNRADYLYISPLFRIETENYKLVFNFRYLRGVAINEHEYTDVKHIFRIRHELLVDIQSHLAQHINRPGVLSLG